MAHLSLKADDLFVDLIVALEQLHEEIVVVPPLILQRLHLLLLARPLGMQLLEHLVQAELVHVCPLLVTVVI